jgi:hypothetical protein
MPCDGTILDAKGVKAEILDALARDEITQEQANKKLAWLKAKNLK